MLIVLFMYYPSIYNKKIVYTTDIRQSPTSSDTKKNDVDDLKMNKMILENEKTQKEIQKLEEEIEVLRVRKNVLLRLQGILSELSQVATKLLKDS